ncbi:hypothetical protein IAE22_30250 [Bacillus sp. S34]|nr:hypothetical protein [Bacillus sp. S34]
MGGARRSVRGIRGGLHGGGAGGTPHRDGRPGRTAAGSERALARRMRPPGAPRPWSCRCRRRRR